MAFRSAWRVLQTLQLSLKHFPTFVNGLLNVFHMGVHTRRVHRWMIPLQRLGNYNRERCMGPVLQALAQHDRIRGQQVALLPAKKNSPTSYTSHWLEKWEDLTMIIVLGIFRFDPILINIIMGNQIGLGISFFRIRTIN